MFVGQLTEVETCMEAKFARRVKSSSIFRWPDVEDKSIILAHEVVTFLPPPTFDKRGKFTFNVGFDHYNVG